MPISTYGRRSRGFSKRTPEEQVALAVAILDGCHDQWVIDLIWQVFGTRAERVANPVDLSRNTLSSYVDRINRVFLGPTFVDDLSAELAMLMGDQSARVTIDRYAAAGGRPMPTPMAQAAHEAHRYKIGAGYGGVLPGWSARAQQLTYRPIAPDVLKLHYTDDDPIDPVRIEHMGTRMHKDRVVSVVEVYDITDPDEPSYRVWKGDEDITADVLGRTFVGDDYLAVWSYDDDTAYIPITIVGNDRNPFLTRSLVEATLMVAARWSAWGVGTDHASHPQRHVRGLRLQMQDSDAAEGGTGIATGPEYVYNWEDIDPVKPGDHWQDAPAFDPLTNAKAIRTYEASAMNAMGIPVDLESTGGEPTETERKAVEAMIAATYPDARRFSSELLRRSAALANRLPDQPSGFNEDPYGVLFRSEVDEVLNVTTTPTQPIEEE